MTVFTLRTDAKGEINLIVDGNYSGLSGYESSQDIIEGLVILLNNYEMNLKSLDKKIDNLLNEVRKNE